MTMLRGEVVDPMERPASKNAAVARAASYGLALVAVGIAGLGRSVLNEVTEPHIPLVAFHIAVLVSGVVGGLGPALVALASGYVVAGVAFAAPRAQFGLFGMPDLWATAAYLVGGTAIAGAASAVHTLLAQPGAMTEPPNANVYPLRPATEPAKAFHILDRAALSTNDGGPLHDEPLRSASGLNTVAAHATNGQGPAESGRRIHVVDDARDSADSLALLLRMHGYDVEVSYDGLSALAADAPDIMIIDVGLPDLSGHEVARRMRIDPRFARTALIALSGFTLNDGRTPAGFDRYLTKPVDLETLRSIIDAI
jgi:CheY-like chemotaxis protein